MRAAAAVEILLAEVPDELGEQRAGRDRVGWPAFPGPWVSVQRTGKSPGLMYSERMVARPPSEAVSCGRPAGIHSARVGGSTNVEVACGDAAALGYPGLGYPDASFDTVATCTMLHHVPTRAGQDKVLAEAFRVLRPAGVFLG